MTNEQIVPQDPAKCNYVSYAYGIEELTPERLRELLHYCPEKGVFVWKVDRGNCYPAGCVAGSLNITGYIQIGILGRLYGASRLAWLYMTGRWPSYEIDHINKVRSDNRWCNLREASASQNVANSTRRPGKSGFRGVQACRSGDFRVQIRHNRRLIHVGTFLSPVVASWMYDIAARRLHGEFATLNHPEYHDVFYTEDDHEVAALFSGVTK